MRRSKGANGIREQYLRAQANVVARAVRLTTADTHLVSIRHHPASVPEWGKCVAEEFAIVCPQATTGMYVPLARSILPRADGARFVNMRSIDLPVVWKAPIDPVHTREDALHLGINFSDVFSVVCFEVPDTKVGLKYQRWAVDNSLPDSVPVMVSRLSDFLHCDGPQRLAQFESSFLNLGRPCHFSG